MREIRERVVVANSTFADSTRRLLLHRRNDICWRCGDGAVWGGRYEALRADKAAVLAAVAQNGILVLDDAAASGCAPVRTLPTRFLFLLYNNFRSRRPPTGVLVHHLTFDRVMRLRW